MHLEIIVKVLINILIIRNDKIKNTKNKTAISFKNAKRSLPENNE